jgi:hypothetical protein
MMRVGVNVEGMREETFFVEVKILLAVSAEGTDKKTGNK